MKPPTLEIILWTKGNNVSKVPCRFLFNSLGIWWPFYLLPFITHDNESVPIFLPKSRKCFTVKNPKLSIWLCFSGFQWYAQSRGLVLITRPQLRQILKSTEKILAKILTCRIQMCVCVCVLFNGKHLYILTEAYNGVYSLFSVSFFIPLFKSSKILDTEYAVLGLPT